MTLHNLYSRKHASQDIDVDDHADLDIKESSNDNYEEVEEMSEIEFQNKLSML